MLNILAIMLTKMFRAELQFLQYTYIILFNTHALTGTESHKSKLQREPRTSCRLPLQGAELHAAFLFLARSDVLGAQKVLSSNGTEDEFKVLELEQAP